MLYLVLQRKLIDDNNGGQKQPGRYCILKLIIDHLIFVASAASYFVFKENVCYKKHNQEKQQ